MSDDFSKMLGPQEILERAAELTKSVADVRALRLLCSEREHNSIVCVVYVDDSSRQAATVARQIDGFMYGDLPARTIAPLASGFDCEGRREGKLVSNFCAKCSLVK